MSEVVVCHLNLEIPSVGWFDVATKGGSIDPSSKLAALLC